MGGSSTPLAGLRRADLGVVVEHGRDQAGSAGDRVGRRQLVDLHREALPVGQAGEPIVVGVVPDQGEQLVLPGRGVDVGEHGVQRGAVAGGEGQDITAPVTDLQVARLPRRKWPRGGEPVASAVPDEGGRLSLRGSDERDQHWSVAGSVGGPPAEEVVGIGAP
jgi:hypothetical protein